MSYEPYFYWEDRAQSWVSEVFNTEEQWKEIEPFVNQSLKVIELGCGTGRWAPYFNNYFGCDISHRLIAHCKINYQDKNFHQLDIEKQPFTLGEPESSMIFTYTCLEHVRPEAIERVAEFYKDYPLLLVEPTAPSGVEHCFQHDYESIFGVEVLKQLEHQTIFGKGL